MRDKYCYCASPFFNKKERRIRDLMVEDFENFKSEVVIRRPDQTTESDLFDGNPCQQSAEKLLNRNISDIECSQYLMFPRYTNDLGTLFEVGYGLKLGKVIYRYDYLTGNFDEIKTCAWPEYNEGIVDLGRVSSAIILGFNYGNHKLGYYLPTGVNDNIMLLNFRRFDKYSNSENTLVEVKVKIVYGDTNSGEKCKRLVSLADNWSLPNQVKFTDNCESSDYLVFEAGNKDGNLIKLIQENFDDILGCGESIKKLYTGVS